MEVVIHYQAMIYSCITLVLLWSVVLYFSPKKLKLAAFRLLVGITLFTLLFSLFTGKYVQKTHSVKQQVITNKLKNIPTDYKVLDKYLNNQPNRERDTSQANLDDELQKQKAKSSIIINKLKESSND